MGEAERAFRRYALYCVHSVRGQREPVAARVLCIQ